MRAADVYSLSHRVVMQYKHSNDRPRPGILGWFRLLVRLLVHRA
jgi:hypothetical protein